MNLFSTLVYTIIAYSSTNRLKRIGERNGYDTLTISKDIFYLCNSFRNNGIDNRIAPAKGIFLNTFKAFAIRNISQRCATIKCVYSDGSIGEAIPLQRKWIDGRNTTVDGPCTLEVTIIYSDKGTRLEKTVTITITE